MFGSTGGDATVRPLKPAAFEYHAPSTPEGAVGLLAELGDEAKVLAGGQSLIPMLSLRLAAFPHLIDVGRIESMKRIDAEPDAVVVGAGVVDAEVGKKGSVPLLALATPLIGHFQIRNRGTLGGSIAHADPAAEYPAVALALDAEMEALSSRGRRRIPAPDFFRGFWSTALADDELLLNVRFPVWTGRCGFAIREFARRHGDFAIAGAVVGVGLDADQRVSRCAIALFGLGPTPLRAASAEASAMGNEGRGRGEELGRLAVSDLAEVPSDLHGSAEYRRRVGRAMVARAWDDAVGMAGHG
jgi:carbon-monoxide dehydrogenase medium subunit